MYTICVRVVLEGMQSRQAGMVQGVYEFISDGVGSVARESKRSKKEEKKAVEVVRGKSQRRKI